MKIEQLTNKIQIDNGKQLYTLTLSELKERFSEKRLRMKDIHWNVFDNYIVFSALIFSYKYGAVNKKILFDTQKATFTEEHTCIHTSGSEKGKTMAEVVLNGQSYEILWDDLRQHFEVPSFCVNMIIYESTDYVIHFKLCCGEKRYLFDFDMKTGTVGNYSVVARDDISGDKSEDRKMMDYKFCMVRIKK